MKSKTDYDAIFIIGDGKENADLLWATSFRGYCAFIQTKDDKIITSPALEMERVKRESKATRFLSESKYEEEVIKKIGKDCFKNLPVHLKGAAILDLIFKELGIKKLLVQRTLGFALGKALEEKGYELVFKEDPFFEERAIKSEEEISYIIEVQRYMERALKRALRVIQNSEIKNGLLYHKGRALTSEEMKRIIDLELFKRGCLAKDTIFSCGKATAMPHDMGTGPLEAHQPIVIDIFPQSMKTGYFADMTRTVVRGRASRKLKKMYQTVLEGQKIALGMIKEGAEGDLIHQAVEDYFLSQGFKTSKAEDPPYGFIHSTGHSLGLEIHEHPVIGPYKKEILKPGNAITIEPGLYYSGLGGVRIEDLVVVTKNGYRNLTKFEKEKFEL